MILFFDTETTGKVDFHASPNAPHQPRLVQFAAMLTNDGGKEMASVNLIIAPETFEIPEEAIQVHGITTQIALEYGVSIEEALPVIRRLFLKSQLYVGHNIEFDLMVVTGEFLRAEYDQDPFAEADTFCTMHAMTPVCKLPGKYDSYKWPKLQEAYHHAFGRNFEDAHDALANVRACKEIYFWLKQRRQPETKAP